MPSGEYYLPVNFGDHVEGTLEIIRKLSYKVGSGELSIYISIED